MTISYHSGERIQATAADFAVIPEVPAVSGGWKEVGRTTLGSSSSTITVSSLPDKKYYMVLCPIKADSSGGTDSNWRFNGDTSGSYARTNYYQGQTNDQSATNQTKIYNNSSGGSRFEFAVMYIDNTSGKDKLTITKNVINWTSGTSGEVNRKSIYGKWDDTDVISSIQCYFSDGGAQAGDELIVLGWDEDDTHTDNFWEELASVQLSSAGDTLDSGTITAKKYLWFQVYTEGANTELQFAFNSDTSSGNYVSRRGGDGGSDSEFTGQNISKINATGGGASHTGTFMNVFVANRSSEEKLAISHQVATESTGTAAPRRSEGVTKWVNTSSQITSIQAINNGSGNFGTDSIIKVWGHD